MLCVICMNAIHLEVDESGCLSQGGQRGAPTQSCSNPFSGCLESIRHYNEVRRARIQLAAQQQIGVPDDVDIELGETSSSRNLNLNSESSDSPEDESNGTLTTERVAETAASLNTSATTNDDTAKVEVKYAKRYMKTPCGHVFHIVCLKKWIDIRLECPTCRQQIPLPEDD